MVIFFLSFGNSTLGSMLMGYIDNFAISCGLTWGNALNNACVLFHIVALCSILGSKKNKQVSRVDIVFNHLCEYVTDLQIFPIKKMI